MSDLDTSAFSMYKKKSKSKKSKKQKRDPSITNSISIDEPKAKKSKKNKAKLLNGTDLHVSLENEPIENVANNKKSKKSKKHKDKFNVSEVDTLKTNVIEANLKQDDSDDEIPQLVEPALMNDVIDDDSVIDFLKENILTKHTATTPTQLLKWLLSPIEPGAFFESYWEKGPLHITRNTPNYYKPVLTSSDLDVMLREHPLYFGRNVDVVKYVDDVRITENPAGRAKASIVWDSYSQGYSIRILNPHTYNEKVHMILSTLQEYFGTMVGANVYLTPAASQGFAPHFDDIEAFIIQLEGRKHWKLYKPKDDCDTLARISSKDFKRKDLGKLMAEITLNAGDILYFPRGCVHEAKTDDEQHSLHMTISTYQKTSYADLLEKILPEALNKAAMSDIEYRKGLPLGYLKKLGVANSEANSSDRNAVLRKVQDLIVKLANYAPIDEAADQLGRKFMHEALPPVLDHEEKQCSSKYDGDRMKKGQIINRGELGPDTEIRLVRYYSLRLAIENGEGIVYFCTENSKIYHGEEEQFLTIDLDMCPSIEVLLQQYPNYIPIEHLPHEDIAKKINLITELWDYQLVVTKNPLEICDSDIESE